MRPLLTATLTIGMVMGLAVSSVWAQANAEDTPPAPTSADVTTSTEPDDTGSSLVSVPVVDGVTIPDANLDEEPVIGLRGSTAVPAAPAVRHVVRAHGGFDAGVMVSARDRVLPVVGLQFGVSRREVAADGPTMLTRYRRQTTYMGLRGLVELGVQPDGQRVSWADATLSVFRRERATGQSTDLASSSLALAWGRVHLSRNLRVERGARLEVTAGELVLQGGVVERDGVRVLLSLRVGMPGYSYVSAQGRADAFHGLQLTRILFEGGPRFGRPEAQWVRFVGGAGLSAAAGAELGPTATFRTDFTVFTGFDVQAHVAAVLGARVHYDVASDTYRNRTDGAWRVQVTAGTRF